MVTSILSDEQYICGVGRLLVVEKLLMSNYMADMLFQHLMQWSQQSTVKDWPRINVYIIFN